MKLIRLRPAKIQLISWAILAIFAASIASLHSFAMVEPDSLIAAILPNVLPALFMGLLLCCLVDLALYNRLKPNITLTRQSEQNISVYNVHTIKLHIQNQSNRTLSIDLVDFVPSNWRILSPKISLNLAASSKQTLSYQIQALQRGTALISATELRQHSLLGLWQFNWLLKQKSEIKVYPNFSAISDLAGLQGSINLAEQGIKSHKMRGAGMDFNQLRDYREGDSVRQIDWAATGRFRKAISREYQEEKNQQVVIMLDAGRRMRVQDDELSYFDHALNSLIMLSYTALKNGDHLSLMSFAEQTRWLGKIKGANQIGRVLNHFYDLYPDKVASDYLTSAQVLLQNQPKRSLVLLVTCLRDEDFSDLLAAVKLLQQKHLVAVVSIEEPVYQSILSEPVESFEQALTYAAAKSIERSIHQQFKMLQHQGAICLSVPAKALTASAINTYLAVKKSGIL